MMKLTDSFNRAQQMSQLEDSAAQLRASSNLLLDAIQQTPAASKTLTHIKPKNPRDLYNAADAAIDAYYGTENAAQSGKERHESVMQRWRAEQSEREERERAEKEKRIKDDEALPGYIKSIAAHTLDPEKTDPFKWMESRSSDHLPAVEATCPFLELPQSRPYHHQISGRWVSHHFPDSRRAAGHYVLPHYADVAGIAKCQENLTHIDVYLWGDDKGGIARRLVLCHAGEDGSDSLFRDETYVGGACRHYAVYTNTGKMLQEVYIEHDGTTQVFKPGLLERIARGIHTILGNSQERPEQPRLQDLRHAGAVSSVMGILNRCHADVALSIASSVLSMRAMLAGDQDSKAEFDRRLESHIVPDYARRVQAAREIAGSYETLQASLGAVASMRDGMSTLPVAQDALNKLIADRMEELQPYRATIEQARTLLASDDNRHAEVRKVGEVVRQAIAAVRHNPQAFDILYRRLEGYYNDLSNRDSTYPQMRVAQDALQNLAQKVDAGLYEYMQKISDQAEAAANFIRSKSPHVDPLANMLSPVEDDKPRSDRNKNSGGAPNGKKG